MTTSTKGLAELRGRKQWKPEDARRVLGAWKESVDGSEDPRRTDAAGAVRPAY
jgi:hypothetical protein